MSLYCKQKWWDTKSLYPNFKFQFKGKNCLQCLKAKYCIIYWALQKAIWAVNKNKNSFNFMLVCVYTYRCILPTNILLPHLKFYLISIAHAAKNAKERWIPTFLLVLIALGVIANKGHMLLPEIYGLNCLFICKRSSQENFLHGHSCKLPFLLSFFNSITKLGTVNGAVLIPTRHPFGLGGETRNLYMWEYISGGAFLYSALILLPGVV